MEARQNKFLFTRIGIDIAHREDAGNIGLKLFCIDRELLALDIQPPFCDRAKFGR